MDKNRKDAYKAALSAFVFSAALLAVMPYLSVIGPPAVLVLVPMALVFAIVKGGYALGGIAAVASFAAPCLINYQLYSIAAAALLPFIFAAAYALREKKRLRDSVMISGVGALAGAVLAIGLVQMMTGMGVVDFLVDRFGKMLSMLNDTEVSLYYQIIRTADVQTGAITQEAVLATEPVRAVAVMQDMLRDALNVGFVLMIVVYAMTMGLGEYVIVRAFAKRRGTDVAALPRFADWKLPKGFWIAAIVSSAAAIIGNKLGWPSFDLLFVTIYSAYAVIFIVQALCLVDFLMISRKMGRGMRVVLLIVSVLIFGSVLMWVGLIENAFDVRRRLKEGWDKE